MRDAARSIPRASVGRPAPFSALLRRVWRVVLRWRFRLFQRHRYNRMAVEHIAGRALIVLPEVFNPALFRTGAFMARCLDDRLIPPHAHVLDMGTGSGIGAVVAAQWAARVEAVDINPHAVRCARINALLNEVDDRVTIHHGDLFAPVAGRRFEVVLFNPPYFRGAPQDDLDAAWRSDDVVERFAAALPDHLTPDGHALVMLSSDGDTPAFLEAFHRAGFALDAAVTRNLINETLTLYRIYLDRP